MTASFARFVLEDPHASSFATLLLGQKQYRFGARLRRLRSGTYVPRAYNLDPGVALLATDQDALYRELLAWDARGFRVFVTHPTDQHRAVFGDSVASAWWTVEAGPGVPYWLFNEVFSYADSMPDLGTSPELAERLARAAIFGEAENNGLQIIDCESEIDRDYLFDLIGSDNDYTRPQPTGQFLESHDGAGANRYPS